MERAQFVGPGRQLLVEGLLSAFDKVSNSAEPLWISLEAPSGWGKTRIAQEFYAELAAKRQVSPAYWPPTIFGSGRTAPADLGQARKQTTPFVQHEPGSLPTYLWWGISSSHRSGTQSSAVEADILALQQHAPYLDDAWRRLATWKDRHPEWLGDMISAVWKEAATESAGQFIGSVLGATIPGVGLVSELVSTALTYRKQALRRLERLFSNEVIVGDISGLIDPTIEMLLKFAVPGFPVVIFIEDAHSFDFSIKKLVSTLIDSRCAILIVSTSWHGAGSANEQFMEAVRHRPDKTIRITHESVDLPSPFPSGASLSKLSETDTMSILLKHYPNVEGKTLQMVLNKYQLPLALEMFCNIRQYRVRFPNGDLRLSQEEIASTPHSLSELYLAMWLELPLAVQMNLTLVSLGVPAALDSSKGSVQSWHEDFFHRAVAIFVDEISEISLDLEIAPLQNRDWVMQISNELWQFLEPAQLHVAFGDSENITHFERNRFLTILAGLVSSEIQSKTKRDLSFQKHTLALVSALYERDYVTDDIYQISLSSYIKIAQWEPDEATTIADSVTQWLAEACERSEEDRQIISWSGALACSRIGSFRRAVTIYEKYLDYAEEHYEFSKVAQMSYTRVLLMEALLSDRSNPDNSVSAARHLEKISRSLGPEHPLVQIGTGLFNEEEIPSIPKVVMIVEDAGNNWAGRRAFKKTEPVPYITFNSIVDNPNHGDERNFVLMRKADTGEFVNNIVIEPGEEYEVYTYFHNNIDERYNDLGYGIATNVRISVTAPSIVCPGERLRVTSSITSEEAYPQKVWGDSFVTSEVPIALRYIPASAVIHCNGEANQEIISTQLFTAKGTYLGWNSLNGFVPGGPEYAGYVIYRLKATLLNGDNVADHQSG